MSCQKPETSPSTTLVTGTEQSRSARNQSNSGGLIFVVSGPSGSGKTTLVKELLESKELKRRMVKSISFTTRSKRSGEQDKKDYFFINDNVFKHKLKANKVLEWTKYLGYYYATPKDYVDRQLKKGKHIILCLDLKGALRLKWLYPKKTILIFISPPSLTALQHRIGSRCNRTAKREIRERLKLARTELLASDKYDYCVVNKNLHQAKRELEGIVLKETGLHRP